MAENKSIVEQAEAIEAADAAKTQPKPNGKGKAFATLCALCGTAVAGALVGDIRDDEGRKLIAYKDIAGIVTICDGDTANVKMGQRASDGECDERTSQQLVNHAVPIIRCIPALREQGHANQLRGVTRFGYNVGVGAVCSGSVARKMNASDFKGGCNAILQYNKARVGPFVIEKGKRVRALVPVRGLTLRRQREVAVCLKGL